MLLEPNRFVWDHNYEIFMKFLQLFAIRQIPGAPPFQIRSIRNKLPRPEGALPVILLFSSVASARVRSSPPSADCLFI
jgi:hypothetical protein